MQQVPTEAPTAAPTAADRRAHLSAHVGTRLGERVAAPRWFDAPYRSTPDEQAGLQEHARTAKERHAERVAKEHARHPKQHKTHANLPSAAPAPAADEAAVLPFFVDEYGVRWEPGPQNMEPRDGMMTATQGPPSHHKTRAEAEAEMEAEMRDKLAREKGDLTSGLTSQLTREPDPNLSLKKSEQRDLTHNNYRRSMRREKFRALHPLAPPEEEEEDQKDPDGTDHVWDPDSGPYDHRFGPTYQEQTIGVEWIVTVTLEEGNAEDVNANFTWDQCECHRTRRRPGPRRRPARGLGLGRAARGHGGGARSPGAHPRPHRIKPPHPPPLPPAAPPPCKSECSATCGPTCRRPSTGSSTRARRRRPTGSAWSASR